MLIKHYCELSSPTVAFLPLTAVIVSTVLSSNYISQNPFPTGSRLEWTKRAVLWRWWLHLMSAFPCSAYRSASLSATPDKVTLQRCQLSTGAPAPTAGIMSPVNSQLGKAPKLVSDFIPSALTNSNFPVTSYSADKSHIIIASVSLRKVLNDASFQASSQPSNQEISATSPFEIFLHDQILSTQSFHCLPSSRIQSMKLRYSLFQTNHITSHL